MAPPRGLILDDLLLLAATLHIGVLRIHPLEHPDE